MYDHVCKEDLIFSFILAAGRHFEAIPDLLYLFDFLPFYDTDTCIFRGFDKNIHEVRVELLQYLIPSLQYCYIRACSCCDMSEFKGNITPTGKDNLFWKFFQLHKIFTCDKVLFTRYVQLAWS